LKLTTMVTAPPKRPRIARRPRSSNRSPADRPPPVALERVAAAWQRALDAAERALGANRETLPAADGERRRRGLTRERETTATLLAQVAAATSIRPAPWLSPVPVTRAMLGVPANARACIFDLDGVLTDSGVLHAQAWAEVFDELLLRLSEKTGWPFIPFDPDEDYRAYMDGRPRIEGIHAFLGSRGIHLPEGHPEDAADAQTANGVARHKNEALGRMLAQRGVTAVPGARRYLEAAGRAGLGRAVVSASTRTFPILDRAGLAPLIEGRVDAGAISAEGLRSRPTPDMLLAACRRLGVRPEDAVTVTSSPAGVAAGRAGGLAVVAVGVGEHGELMRGFGAERVVPQLSALLDPRLAGISL
jgi:HAD superfamily hydrolase (TIGR01509 family)